MPSSGWEGRFYSAGDGPSPSAQSATARTTWTRSGFEIRFERRSQPGGRRRRRLGGQNFDDRNPALVQRRGLVATDEPSAEDDREINIRKLVLGRLSLCLDREPRLLEQAAEIGLAGREKQNSGAPVSVPR